MAPPLDSNKSNCPLEMVNAFILFGLLIAANAYFLVRSRRKIRRGRDAIESNEPDENAGQ